MAPTPDHASDLLAIPPEVSAAGSLKAPGRGAVSGWVPSKECHYRTLFGRLTQGTTWGVGGGVKRGDRDVKQVPL